MNYCMNLGAWNHIFAVPCEVVDQHIRLAGAVQLKILLWLLRHRGEQCTAESISAGLGMAEMDGRDGIQYWVEVGLIAQKEQEFSPAPISQEISEPTIPPVALVEENSVAEEEVSEEAIPVEKTPRKAPPRLRNLNPADIVRRINESEEIKSMIEMTDMIFGRDLSTPEMGRIVDLYDWYGLPAEVVVMLIQYAASVNKANMNYIEKLAQNWAEQEINTHEKAEEKINELERRTDCWKQVCTIFGISSRLPSNTESEASYRWLEIWKFSPEILREAYNRCVDSTGKMQFTYINRILERWNKEGIRTIKDVMDDAERTRPQAQKPATPSPAKGAKKQTSYDIEAFEQMNNDL